MWYQLILLIQTDTKLTPINVLPALEFPQIKFVGVFVDACFVAVNFTWAANWHAFLVHFYCQVFPGEGVVQAFRHCTLSLGPHAFMRLG